MSAWRSSGALTIATPFPAAGRPGPLLFRPVAVELDPVPVGIAEVDRLGDAVVGRAVDRPTGLGEPPQRVAERAPVRVADRDVIEPGRPRRRSRPAARLPGVQSEVMVVPPGRDEGRLVADPLRHVEAQDVAVEGEGAVDVGDLQVDVTDVDSGIEAHRADDTPVVVGAGALECSRS